MYVGYREERAERVGAGATRGKEESKNCSKIWQGGLPRLQYAGVCEILGLGGGIDRWTDRCGM